MGSSSTGTAFSAGSSIVGGVEDLKSSKYEAGLLEDNARVAEQIADQALWRGELEARRRGLETGQVAGMQRAAIADAGFDAGYGSSLDILAETAGAAASDAELIRYNAELEAWKARVDAANFRNQAALTRWSGRISAHAGAGAGIGSALGGSGGGTAGSAYSGSGSYDWSRVRYSRGTTQAGTNRSGQAWADW